MRFENVALTLDRWTKYPGRVWDNRPTTAMPDLEPHDAPAISVRHADYITLQPCRAGWSANSPDYFTHAIEAENVTGLTHLEFKGEAAHPSRDRAIVVR